MADPREFVLIGNFVDNISPSLVKINKSLEQVKNTLESVTKSTKPLNKEFKDLAETTKSFSSSLKGQAADLREITAAMRAMRSEMGRVNRAYRAAGRNRNILPPPPTPPRSRRGFTPPPPPPPRPPKGFTLPPPPPKAPRIPYQYSEPYKAAGRRGYAAEAGGMVTGGVMGMQLASLMENAIVSGFRIGTQIMTVPFEYFAKSLKERIEDEQSDIKAAGGLFSIAKRQKDPFVRTMDEAMEFTQANNKYLAELAAALPGNTQQYIEVSKRISDSISRIVTNNKEGAIEFANQLRRERGAEEITGGAGRKQTQAAITELLGQMTKKTVLAGLGGGGGGPGGLAGAYGLPQLTERMLTQDQVSMGQFQRYAAIFRDPLIMDALSRFIPKVNATTAGTLERFKVLDKLFDEVLPPEMIRKFERSTAGILEAFNTAFLGPETGFLGLGRKMQGLGKRMNDYGQYIKVLEDGTMVVVESIKEASDVDLSIFDMLRDVFANFAIALYPIADYLPTLFDPLKKIGLTLQDIRHESGRFLFAFESYKKGLKELADQMIKEGDKVGAEKILKNLDLRATLAAINNAFRKFGVIDVNEFKKNAEKIMAADFDAGAMIKGFFSTFMESGMAKEFGRTIGTVVGTVLAEIANFAKQLVGMTEASGLVSGLKEGFNKAGGVQAIKDIIGMVFAGIAKLVVTIVKTAPFESAMVAGLFVLPSIISGIVTTAVTTVFTQGAGFLREGLKNAISRLFQVKPITVKDLGSPITDPSRMLPAAKDTALATTKAGPLAKGMNSFSKFFMKFGAYIKGVGPRFMGFFKGLLGKLTIFGGIITSVISLFQGKDLATSLAEGAGPVLGAALGAALIPFLGPIGPMIGSLVGGWIGSLDMVTVPLTEMFRSLLGSLQGFGDVIKMVITLTGDLFGEVGQLIGSIFGVKGEFDGFKLAIAPITLALQALEVGLKGFALLLAEMRVFFKRYFGSSEEYQAAIAERDRLNASMKESQGRINAYNASMLGTANLQKQVNDAQYELINGGKKLTQARKAELVAFIEAAQKLDKEIELKKDIVVKTKEKAEEKKPAPQAKPEKPQTSTFWQDVQSTLSSRWKEFSQWFSNGITQTWQDIQSGKIFYNLALSISQSYTKVREAVTFVINQVSSVWSQFSNWFMSLPGKLQTAWNYTVAALSNVWSQFSNWFVSLPGKLRSFVANALAGLQQAWNLFTAWFASLPGKFKSAVASAFANMGNVTAMLASAIRDWLKNAVSQAIAGWRAGQNPAPTTTANTPSSAPTPAQATGTPGVLMGSLAKAVSYEQKHKPPGSDLVVANSSETVIPAAKGLGMKEFMKVLTSGFSIVNQQYKALTSGVNTLNQETNTKFQQAETVNSDRYQKTSSAITNYHKQNQEEFGKINQNLLQLSQKVATMSSMGGMFGGGMELGGGYGGAGVQIAGQLGNFIKQTGGAPGSIHEHPMHGGVKGKHAPGSYHYSGRAIDIGAYANEQAGVIARIKQFNAQYGVKPVEFLHAGNDPNHQDHVHVAYNQGNLSPLFDELQKMPRGAKVGFANTSEMVANKDQTKLLSQAIKSTQEPLPWITSFIRSVTSQLQKGFAQFHKTVAIALQSNESSPRAPYWDPYVEQFVVNPLVNQPVIEPIVNQPVVNPLVNQPVVNPLVNQPVVNPFVNQPVIEPIVNQPLIEPVLAAPVKVPDPYSNPPLQGNQTFTVSAPITINQQPGQDADELASIVALKIGEAVADARAASIFV